VLDVEFDAEPNSAAAIQRVAVWDAAKGRVLTAPERGRPFTIEMTFALREPIPDMNVALILIDELGAVIIDAAARDRPAGAALSGDLGVCVASALVPPLLRAGR